MIDPLERRQLLAATVSVFGRTLRLEGTSGNDVIEIARFGKTQAQVFESGVATRTFDLGEIDAVSFAGLDGDDVIVLGRAPLRLYFEGGAGKDAASASQGRYSDTLIGDDGDDYLFGGDGNDTLIGGAGYDGLFGDGGDDYLRVLSDSAGDDTVTGGPGIDTVDAQDYARGVELAIGDRTPSVLTVDDFTFEDLEVVVGTGFSDNISIKSGRPVTVFLGRGYDIFTGGRGNDTVYGGRGRDSIATAGGDDLIVDVDGEIDALNGGSGTDTARVDPADLVDDVETVVRVA